MSKARLFVLSILASMLVFASSSVYAQTEAADSASPENKTILSYKKELGMTDKQEKDLRVILDGFQKYFEEKKSSLMTVEKEISDLVNSKGDLNAIKTKIDALAKLKADVTFKDIETSRSVETVLKPEQIEQWKMIQTEAIEQLKKQMAAQNAAAMPTEPAK